MGEYDEMSEREPALGNEDQAADADQAVSSLAPQTKSEPPRRDGPRFTRRTAVLLAGVGALAAVGGATALAVRGMGRSKAPPGTIADHRVALAPSIPKLVVARGPSVTNNLNAALGRLGGMGQFIQRGEVVLIKPNIGWDRTPAQGANTDPELVAALVRTCLEAGAAEVIVTDRPVNDPARCFAQSGIGSSAEQAGARVLLPEQTDIRSVDIAGKLGRWSVLEPFFRATKLINVPVAKHHDLTQVTAGMKNWLGAIRQNRGRLHHGIHESLASLAALMLPTLTVIDASRVLLRNGPAGGNLDDVKRLDTIAVSLDPVAADAWAATQLGVDPGTIEYLRLGEQRGLGKVDFRSLGPIEITA